MLTPSWGSLLTPRYCTVSRSCTCLLDQPSQNWHRLKEASHARLIELISKGLQDGPRALSKENLFIEEPIQNLPKCLGFAAAGSSVQLLTPDMVALDEAAAEILVIEVTICPDTALPSYIGRKARKYKRLCQHASPLSPLRVVRQPLIVAIGTSGFVPDSTRMAMGRILALDDSIALDDASLASPLLQNMVTGASAVARTRPDAAAVRQRTTRRQRRTRHRGAGDHSE